LSCERNAEAALGRDRAGPRRKAVLACCRPSRLCRCHVPRFSVTAEHDLLAHPEVFGLGAVTDATRGHFPLLSTFPFAVQAAKQVMAASFTELGFEAAAVTYAALTAGGVPPLRPHSIGVCFDRPFGFVARLRSSGLVLAAGWVAEPEAYRFVAAPVD
jgi:serine protease inhibitor